MIVGADLYLNSVWDAWRAKNQELFRNAPASDATSDDASTNGKMFDEIRASGGYFRNSYNSDDVMWAMGLSWPDTVGVLLDSEGYLAVERTRELLAMIAARPLTKERLTQHYFDYIIHGIRAASDHRLAFPELGRAADRSAGLRQSRRPFAAAPQGADRNSKKIDRSQRAAALLSLGKGSRHLYPCHTP
jgi:hypothetical protein